MTLYSYIVRWDGGFAPNPFFGHCTLACCKAGIRRKAKKGDWIVGLTPKAKGKGNKIVYFMEVEEILPFDEYWGAARFKVKRPRMDAGIVEKNGDNIYQPSKEYGDGFHQLPSVHSEPKFGKTENLKTKKKDLKGERVLVSRNFAYFGSEALRLPRALDGLKIGVGYRCHFSTNVQEAFRHFVGKQKLGVHGSPHLWPENDKSWRGSGCAAT
jgi:hypothetical protein